MTEEVKTENMGIMAKLKKLQKERLIVARLGFPDKAMEIDDHIEKIRADLRVRTVAHSSHACKDMPLNVSVITLKYVSRKGTCAVHCVLYL